MNINFEKIRDVTTPIYSSDGAAALDFFIPYDIEWESKTLAPRDSVCIASGICVELPPDVCLIALNKSSLGRLGLNVGACLIDPDYRGEIHINVFNTSNSPVSITRGQKLVQFIAVRFERIFLVPGKISQTERGQGAFGSTGKF